MACRLYNTERCLQHQLFNRPNFGVHFRDVPRHNSLKATMPWVCWSFWYLNKINDTIMRL